MEEDIKIFEECLLFPRKWAFIAKKLRGRNQHQVKNRFVSVLAKELCLKRKEAIEMLLDEKLMPLTRNALESLKVQLKNREIIRNQYIEEQNFELPHGFIFKFLFPL